MQRLIAFLLLIFIGRTALSTEQYFHCEYLDAVATNWDSGLIERNNPSSRQYIGKKFSINRQTGEIRPVGDGVVMNLFQLVLPEVHKADGKTADNFQLIWREKHGTGYQQVTFLNVREAQKSKPPYQFVHVTTTDWFLTGLCHPSFRP